MGRHKSDPLEAALDAYEALTTDQRLVFITVIRRVEDRVTPKVQPEPKRERKTRRVVSLGQAGIPPAGQAG